ncbi:MAG: site-specific tyrosine recombinase/integron integrase [Nonlabens sp.]
MDSIQIILTKHRYAAIFGICFEYDEQLIAFLKSGSNARYSASRKFWYVPKNKKQLQTVIRLLKKHQYRYECDDGTQDFLDVYHKDHRATLLAFKEFLASKRYSQSTIDTYFTFIKQIAVHIKKAPLKSLDAEQLRSYIISHVDKKKLSISTHRQMISAVKQFYEFTGRPLEFIEQLQRPKRSKHLPTVISQIEVLQLLQKTYNLKHRMIIAMLYSCGLRIGELLELRVDSIDLQRMCLHVKMGKGRKDRYVPLANQIKALLHNYLTSYQPSDYFIAGNDNKSYSASSVRAMLKRSCLKADISKKITPHDLRHSYATHLVENGVNLRIIQELLGHSRPETTMIYTHVARKDLDKITNPLDAAVSQWKLLRKDNDNRNMRLSR